MEKRHPWQLFPGQLIRYAIDHLHRSSEFDQIVGFLLLDVGVETLLKVFLLLPEEVTTTDMPYRERRSAAEGNFHALVRGVEKAAKTAGDRLKDINLRHVEYFHNLRNKLYHAGNGITVQGDHSEQYSQIALELLDRLLEIPLKHSLEEGSRKQRDLNSLSDELDQVKASLKAEIHVLKQDLRLAIEKVEPLFLMPSFELEVENWSIEGLGHMLLSDPRFFDEVTLEVGEKLPDEHDTVGMSEDGARVRRFRRNELHKLMPSSLRRFADKHQIETSTAARLLTVSDMTEFLLIVAEVAFDLPPAIPTTRAYDAARVFLVGPPPPSPTNMEPEDCKLRRTIREGQSLVTQLEEIREAIEASAV